VKRQTIARGALLVALLTSATASAAPICEAAIHMDYGTTSTPRPKLAIETCHRVEKSAQAYGVRPSLAVAISSAESTFRPWIVSRAGAVGAMQVKPHYHCPKRFGVRFCLSSRELIDSGVRHLADLLETLDERTALRSYNAGRRGARLGRGERYAATVARIERRIR
jgi:soluble lytic murein transglycosylase-like protein